MIIALISFMIANQSTKTAKFSILNHLQYKVIKWSVSETFHLVTVILYIKFSYKGGCGVMHIETLNEEVVLGLQICNFGLFVI